MAHFLCHLGCSHFGALLLDFYFTENRVNIKHFKSCSLYSCYCNSFYITFEKRIIKSTYIRSVSGYSLNTLKILSDKNSPENSCSLGFIMV